MRDLVAVVKATNSSSRMGRVSLPIMEKGTQVRELLPKTEVNTHKQGKEGKTQVNNANAGSVERLGI